METLKEVVHGIVSNKPLAEVVYGVQQSRAATEASLARVNPIFEDLRGDSELHARWHFFTTLGRHAPPAFDLYRMVRELVGAVPPEARDQLDTLSQQVSAVRARIGQETATEQDHCLYLHFLDTVALHVENSPVVFRVELPADNDGVNGQVAGATALQYDSWQIERLVTVMRLFALYANPRDQLSAKQRIEQYQRCVDYMRELQALCAQSPSQPRRVYKRPLTSLSSGEAQRGGGAQQQGQYPDARTFVELYLGGQAGIEARQHLCEALRCTEIHRDLNERKLGESGDALLAMGAIVEAYDKARAASERQNKANKLSYHARFMHHMWLCKVNLAIAQREAQKGDQVSLSEAMQRVECITRLHRGRTFDKRSFTVSAPLLLEQYNPVITTASQSFAEWDETLLQAGVRPAERDFAVEKYVFPEKPSLYAAGMARCAATLQAPLQLLGALLGAGPMSPSPLASTTNTNAYVTPAMQDLLARVSDGDSARLGALVMQEAWIQWILQLAEQNEFIVNVQYIQLLQSELEKTRDALARH